MANKKFKEGNLVLTRKRLETIVICDGLITITVVGIKKDKVRLSINAPYDIPVVRKELLERENHASKTDNQETISSSQEKSSITP